MMLWLIYLYFTIVCPLHLQISVFFGIFEFWIKAGYLCFIKTLYVQSNFNGLNIFGTVEIYSNYG